MDSQFQPAASHKQQELEKSDLGIADVLASSKADEIRDACAKLNVRELHRLSISERGLLHDDLRKLAWPILLGSESYDTPKTDSINLASDVQSLAAHKDEEQVALDVDRSFVYYPDDSTASLPHLKKQLSNLIISVLRQHPALSYFQGYHDIAQVLLLVLGPATATPALARLSLLRIRDFMLSSMSGAIAHLHLLPVILRASDPELTAYLPPNPFWALSATLTLYAHDVQSYAHIARLFDFLLAAPAIASLYLFAALVRARRDELLEIDPDDHDILHVTLTRLPANQQLDLDRLIADACFLLEKHPPHSLGRAWKSVSQLSVLRTVPDVETLRNQALQEGEATLIKQSREAEKQDYRIKLYRSFRENLEKWQRPAVYGATLTVMLLALYIGRNDDRAGRSTFLGSIFLNVWRSLGGVPRR